MLFLDGESQNHILERHIFWDWDPAECTTLVIKRIENVLKQRPDPEVIQNIRDGVYLRSIILVFQEVIGIDHQGHPLTSMYVVLVQRM